MTREETWKRLVERGVVQGEMPEPPWNLTIVDLKADKVIRADLTGADLSGADLRRAKLIKAVLRGADLSGADLSGARLRGADLSEAILSKAVFSKAVFRGAVLKEANLIKADLKEANLKEANLYKAVLSGAVLRGADLSGADLSGADLSRAHLSGADLNEYTKTGGIKGCQVGVDGIWSEGELFRSDSAALMTLTPPGNSMLGSRPAPVIESLRRARRLHGTSLSLAGIVLLIALLGLQKIKYQDFELSPENFGLLGMLISICLISLANSFMVDALKGSHYIRDRESAMAVGKFPWALSRYVAGPARGALPPLVKAVKRCFAGWVRDARLSLVTEIKRFFARLLQKAQSVVTRFVMAFHPLVYVYYWGKWDNMTMNLWDNPLLTKAVIVTSLALLLPLSIWTFVLSQSFQKPILFDRTTELERKDDASRLADAVEKLVGILKPKEKEEDSSDL